MTAYSEKNTDTTFKYRNDSYKFLASTESRPSSEALSRLAQMSIILLGIPGAGKTTLSEELTRRNDGIDYISVGDISRNLPPDSLERIYLNELFKGEAPTGDPEFFLQLIESRIDAAKERGAGFILDGIPKKIEEVTPLLQFLSKKDIEIDAVISCEVSPLVAYGRIVSRSGRVGDEDSMAVFVNRTQTYLAGLNEFKHMLTADGASLCTLDTGTLDQNQCIDHLLSMPFLAAEAAAPVAIELY
jgi:adenylate kinase